MPVNCFANTRSPTNLSIRIKVVPNSSRDMIAGLHGDRLKVRVRAAPEDGKANKAVCALIARTTGTKPAQVQVSSGHTNQEKTVCITDCTIEHLSQTLGIDASSIVIKT
jgi:uncharacterized protein